MSLDHSRALSTDPRDNATLFVMGLITVVMTVLVAHFGFETVLYAAYVVFSWAVALIGIWALGVAILLGGMYISMFLEGE